MILVIKLEKLTCDVMKMALHLYGLPPQIHNPFNH